MLFGWIAFLEERDYEFFQVPRHDFAQIFENDRCLDGNRVVFVVCWVLLVGYRYTPHAVFVVVVEIVGGAAWCNTNARMNNKCLG